MNFQVSTYVTKASTTGADYKRVTVVTRWTIAGHQRERMSSSIVTATSRGLPIPLFTFKVAANAQTINPNVDSIFKVEITNQGAPDRWDLTTSNGTWEFWKDNGDNVLCVDLAGCGAGVAQDTLMTDGDDAGSIVDTGRMDPTVAVVFWAVRKGSGNPSVGDYWTNLTATAVSVDHDGVLKGIGVQTLALLTRVTDSVVTQPPVQVSPSPTTGLPEGPGVPRNVTATVGDGQLTVNWIAPETLGTGTLTDYVVEYKRPSDASWSIRGHNLHRDEPGAHGPDQRRPRTRSRVAAKTTVGTGGWSGTQGTPTGGATYTSPTFCPTSVPADSGCGLRCEPRGLHPAVEEGRGLARHRYAAAAVGISPGCQAPGHAGGPAGPADRDHAASPLLRRGRDCHRQGDPVRRGPSSPAGTPRRTPRTSPTGTSRQTWCAGSTAGRLCSPSGLPRLPVRQAAGSTSQRRSTARRMPTT